MASQQNKKAAKGTPSRTGKRKDKFPKYFANTAAKKLRRVVKHNGSEFARAWKDARFDKAYRAIKEKASSEESR